jgi:DNA-binding transcriptional ArsR family regulator
VLQVDNAAEATVNGKPSINWRPTCAGAVPQFGILTFTKINLWRKVAKPKGCAYICNRIVSQLRIPKMRRDIFQAIADPTRRAIIALIALQAMTPNAIADNFNTTRQAISKHLRILTECELVKQEQKGREIYYSLEVDKMKEIDRWLEQFRKIWETRFKQLDNLLSTIKKNRK